MQACLCAVLSPCRESDTNPSAVRVGCCTTIAATAPAEAVIQKKWLFIAEAIIPMTGCCFPTPTGNFDSRLKCWTQNIPTKRTGGLADPPYKVGWWRKNPNWPTCTKKRLCSQARNFGQVASIASGRGKEHFPTAWKFSVLPGYWVPLYRCFTTLDLDTLVPVYLSARYNCTESFRPESGTYLCPPSW